MLVCFTPKNLIKILYESYLIPLGIRYNPIDMLNNFDSAAGEHILFREPMITTVNNGKSDLVELEVS